MRISVEENISTKHYVEEQFRVFFGLVCCFIVWLSLALHNIFRTLMPQ